MLSNLPRTTELTAGEAETFGQVACRGPQSVRNLHAYQGMGPDMEGRLPNSHCPLLFLLQPPFHSKGNMLGLWGVTMSDVNPAWGPPGPLA